jgi:thiosulfate/3-mercaptopyruvate sulfurtransferase
MRMMWAVGAAIVMCLALGGLPVVGQQASSSDSVEFPDAYVHPEVLVDTDWVAAHLEDPTVRIVDTRADNGSILYGQGHIPGAVFVDIWDELCCPSDIMEAEPFAELMGEKGIGDGTTVVLYDDEGGLWGARLWWALQYYGHEDAKLLDGGLGAWLAEGLPFSTDPPEVEPAVFTAEVRPAWYAAMDDVRAAIHDPAISIVDALPGESYRSGHIPSAVSLPAPGLLQYPRGVKGAEDLSAMLEEAGLDPAQRTITYCAGGYYGAFAAFVLYLMGFEDVAMYDGALEEWTRDPSNPVETAPLLVPWSQEDETEEEPDEAD